MSSGRLLKALGSGVAGACALTLVHEGVRRVVPNAPRMDILGMRAITGMLKRLGKEPRPEKPLHDITLAGDLVANSLYYSVVGTQRGKAAWATGMVMGLAAGLGALLLPGPMGLGREPSQRTPETRVMTVGWYLIGGLAAAIAANLLNGDEGD